MHYDFYDYEGGYLEDGDVVGTRYADLLVDDVFKLAFGQESTKDVMIEFLNRIISDKCIVDLEFCDKEMTSLDRREKNSVYDMNCRTSDGTRIIVELQRRKQQDYAERTIYYSTFQIRNQIDSGSRSYDFCPVYVINILDFNLDANDGNPEVLTTYRLYEKDSHNLLTDKYTLIFIELKKFKKKEEELGDDILDGIYFCLKNMYRLRHRPKQLEHDIFTKIFDVTELANMDDVKRIEILRKMTTERDLRNQMDYATKVGLEEGRAKGMAEGLAEGRAKGMAEGLAEGRAKGMEEGLAEGRAEGRVETIRKMLDAGVAMSIIADALGLTEEEQKKLLSE